MNTLSLFDGIGGALVALKQSGILSGEYVAVDVDALASSFVDGNHSSPLAQTHVVLNTAHSDVTSLTSEVLIELASRVMIDLLIGGSPCIDVACCKQNRDGIQGESSRLFFEYTRIWRTLKEHYSVAAPGSLALHDCCSA